MPLNPEALFFAIKLHKFIERGVRMDKRKTKSLQKRIHKHARENCASHTGEDGCLLTMHEKCVLSFEADRVSANVCPYYMKAVGPGEPVLFDEYVRQFPDGYPLKPDKSEFPDKCERCHQRYKKSSNRQKYCERCQSEVKRDQAKTTDEKEKSKRYVK